MDDLGGSGNRRERIMKIIKSESSTDVVDAAVGLVLAISDVQSKGTHSKMDQPTALFTILETEHILYFLLKQHASSS